MKQSIPSNELKTNIWLATHSLVPIFLFLIFNSLPVELFNANMRGIFEFPIFCFLGFHALITSLSKHQHSLKHFYSSLLALVMVSLLEPFSSTWILYICLSFGFVYLSHYVCILLFKSSFALTCLLSLDILFFMYSKLVEKPDSYLPLSVIGMFFNPNALTDVGAYLYWAFPVFCLLFLKFRTMNNDNSGNEV